MTLHYTNPETRKLLAARAADLMNAALGEASPAELRIKADACVNLCSALQLSEGMKAPTAGGGNLPNICQQGPLPA